MKYIKSKLRKWLLPWVVKHLYNGLTEDDILTEKQGKMYWQGRRVGETEEREIVSGAKALRDLPFFEFLLRELEATANKRMFYKAKDYEDVYFARAMLFSIDVLRKKVHNLSNRKLRETIKEEDKSR